MQTAIRAFKRTLAHFAHPVAHRNPQFAKLSPLDVNALKNTVQPGGGYIDGHEDPAAIAPHNLDWTRKYCGSSSLVLRPASVEQVSRILAYCNSKRIAVVPQGGNTGLVGGGVPLFDEVIVEMSRLNKIREIKDEGVLICEAGCILETLDDALREHGFMMPLDLGAKGSCQLGGNLATNAGGVRMLRYGSLHGSVLGLQVVLANGEVLEDLSTVRKNNTGYDLKQLFIGSEGTLGIITAAVIKTPPAPMSVNVGVFAVSRFEQIQQIFRKAQADFGEILSAFEFWDAGSHGLLRKHLAGFTSPLGQDSPFYILLETSGTNAKHDAEKLSTFLDDVMGLEMIKDGTIAQDQSQAQYFWKLRESIPEVCSQQGIVYKYDISLPLAQLYELVEIMKKRLAGTSATSVIGYGHVGDGNLHLNVATPEYDEAVVQKIEPFIYEFVAEHRGSISAEHGIGIMKAPFLRYSKSAPMINAMKQIKGVFDPRGILNPYKLF